MHQSSLMANEANFEDRGVGEQSGAPHQPAQARASVRCTYPATGSQCSKAKERANEANFTWPLNMRAQ